MVPYQASQPASRLLKLSEIIARNSKLLNSHLVERRLPQPSFAADAPPDGIVIQKDEPGKSELERARRELVTATKELHDLSVGAREGMRNLAWDFNNQLSLHFIIRNRIAQAFTPGTTITFTELSEKTSLPIHDLKRLIRHSIAHSRIFSEPAKNTIAHTTSSALLADPTAEASDWASMCLEEFWPAATNTVTAMQKWKGSQEPTHTGLSVALGEEKHLFQHLSSHPARMKVFQRAMRNLSEGEGFEIEHLVSGYDWGRVDRRESGNNNDGEASSTTTGVVVDVGGSLGHACTAIGKVFTNIHFVVQDLGKVYNGLSDLESRVPEHMKGRMEFMPHDFFEPQTVRADVYLIRWCMHNWSDKYAVKILKALVPSLKRGARVVVNDGVLPEPLPLGASWRSSAEITKEAQDEADKKFEEGSDGGDAVVRGKDGGEEVNAHWPHEKSMRTMDLIMLEGLNARERDVDEWKDLFKEADERFIWKSAWQPEGCKMWIIEAEWAG